MKTPERWRPLPRHALFASILAWKTFEHVFHVLQLLVTPKRTNWRRDVTWCHDVMPWHNMPSCVMTKWICTRQPIRNSRITFSTWRPWPMTLTLKLVQDIVKIHPHTNFHIRMSNCSAVRALTDGQTHRWTDRRVRFYTLDRWRGRELAKAW